MSVLKAGALSMAALAALGVTRLVHGSLVSHATDKATYGLVGALIATSTIASLLLPGGLSSAAAKFIAFHRGAADPMTARAAYRFLSGLAFVSAALLGVGAALAATGLFHLSMGDAVAVGLLTATYSVYTVEKSALYGFGRVAAYARLEVSTSLLAIAATVLVVVAGWGGYLLPLALGYAVFVAVARLLLRRDKPAMPADPTSRRKPLNRREMLGYTAFATVGTLASMGFLQGTQVLASRVATPQEVAYFAAAVVLVGPMYFLPRALSLALFPAMAQAHGAGDSTAVSRQADLSTRSLLVLLAPIFAAAFFLAPVVLTVFGGAGYAEGAPVLRLMLLATYFAVAAVPAVNSLSSGSHVRVPTLAAVVGCGLGLVVVVLVGPVAGATGVGVGYLVGTVVTAGTPIVVAWRVLRLRLAGVVTRSLAAVIGSFAVAWWWPTSGGTALAVAGALVVLLLAALPLVADRGGLRRAAADSRRARGGGATVDVDNSRRDAAVVEVASSGGAVGPLPLGQNVRDPLGQRLDEPSA